VRVISEKASNGNNSPNFKEENKKVQKIKDKEQGNMDQYLKHEKIL
jgi:hypothetical protein